VCSSTACCAARRSLALKSNWSFSFVGLAWYDIWNWRIDFELNGVLRRWGSSILVYGGIEGRVIVSTTRFWSIGHILAFVNANLILSLVKAFSQAGKNSDQNLLFVIETIPKPFVKKLFTSQEYVVDNGWNRPTSRGYSRWVEWGGKISTNIHNSSHLFKKAILTWLEWPSTIKRRLLFPTSRRVWRSKTCTSHFNPNALLLQPLLDAPKYASSVSSKSSTYVSWRSNPSPL
jgi:hypothetical protein